MQRGMFVLLDSDVEEEELKAVSKKLKKMHRRMKSERKERLKRSSVSPAPTPSPPESDTASTNSVASTTVQSEPPSVPARQRKTKRKRNEEAEEAPVRGKKPSRSDHQRDVVESESKAHSSFDKCLPFSSTYETGNNTGTGDLNTGCSIQTRTYSSTSTVSYINTSRANGDCRVPVNGEVVLTSSQSKSISRRWSMWGKPTKSEGAHSGRNESFSGNAVCLTNCKSCSSYLLPTLSDKDLEEMTNFVALDCEFVGVGPNNKSALGRCSIVDHRGVILYDRFVTPDEPVTDYRTRWSGLRPRNLKCGIPFVVAQEQIAKVIEDKVVVGHAVHNDFMVMGLPHPVHCIRDTASCRLLKEKANMAGNACALRKLTQALLGRTIQTNEHCSVTDARACMDLFRLVRTSWEPVLQAKFKRREARYTPDNTPGDKHPELKSFLDDRYWPSNIFADSY